MATRSATADISLRVLSTLNNLLADGSKATATVGANIIQLAMENGVSADQLNRAWYQKDISISSGSFTDIDIMAMTGEDIGAGNGNDALGQAMDIEEVVALVVKCTAGPGHLEIADTLPGAAPLGWVCENFATWANGGSIRPGGLRAWIECGEDGLDISASSSVLRLHAATGDVTAEVLVLGRHDDDESSSSSTSSSSTSTSSQS